MLGLGLVHYEFRLVWEFSSRLDAAGANVWMQGRLGLDQNLWRTHYAAIVCG